MLDPTAEHLLGLLVGLDDELSRRLRAAEHTAVTLSAAWSAEGTLERVSSTTDHDEAMLILVRGVAAWAAELRAIRKARHQGLRREIAKYRQALGYDPPASAARPPTVVDPGTGPRPIATQTSGPDNRRRIEGQHEPGESDAL